MWICIKHDCSGMVGDECPHCATARLLHEEKERLLKSFPVDCKVMLTLADIKEEFPKWLVKINGDAGEYRIFGYDFYNERILAERSCGMEWVALTKCKFISKCST